MIVLVDQNIDMVGAWRKYFPYDVPIVHGDILTVSANALVAPGNSSGAMTGGLDLAIAQKWPFLAPQVYAQPIMEVGTTVKIPFPPESQFEFLIYAPTMRGAMDVSQTDNAYRTMRAILENHHYQDLTIAIPGLCARVGKMSVEKVAEQMWNAWIGYGETSCE